MFNKLRISGVASLIALICFGASLVYANDAVMTEELETAQIIGSAEHPDPVLVRVRDLEKKGILKNVIVMESFPVKIIVTGPKSIIKNLQAMPRKLSPSFK